MATNLTNIKELLDTERKVLELSQALDGNFEALNQDIADIASDVSTLKNWKTTAAGQISDLQSASTTQGGKITTLEGYVGTPSDAAAEDGSLYARVTSLKEAVSELQLSDHLYCIAAWNKSTSSTVASARVITSILGSTAFAENWHPYLIDVTAVVQGEPIHPLGRLMKNNWLKYKDGNYAPVVGISAAMEAECASNALYLDPSATDQYCAAGAFNPEAFYAAYPNMDQKLYLSDGTEVSHILRPWETTEIEKYTIGIAHEEDIYVLDSQVGTSGKCWSGISGEPMAWDGIEFTKYKLSRTAMSPGPATTVGGKTRNFFSLYNPNSGTEKTNTSVTGNIGNKLQMFQDGRLYPRVSDMEAVTNMKRGRNNNVEADYTGTIETPIPFAEGGYHALNAFIISQEVRYGTKYLHDPALFSSGISSNDSFSNETNWKLYGGVRCKLHSSDTWQYKKWSDQFPYTPTSGGTKQDCSNLFTGYGPKISSLEAQIALSYATERGIAPNTEFEMYGNTYWYSDVTGATSLASGHMNARLYKMMSETVTLYQDTTEVSVDIEVVLRVGILEGMDISGDIYAYWNGGYEQVGTITQSGSGSVGNPVKMYLEPDQSLWHFETTITKTDGGVFNFENDYLYLGQATNLGDGYTKLRMPYSAWQTMKGGGISTGECYYSYSNSYWNSNIGQRTRIAQRFRGDAYYTTCSSRFVNASLAASHAHRNYAGSVQARIH